MNKKTNKQKKAPKMYANPNYLMRQWKIGKVACLHINSQKPSNIQNLIGGDSLYSKTK